MKKLEDVFLGIFVGSALTSVLLCVYLAKAPAKKVEKPQKRGNVCFIEVEHKAAKYPLYELHPLEDCEE